MTRHDKETWESLPKDPIVSDQIEGLKLLITILEHTNQYGNFPVIPLLEALTDVGMSLAQTEIYVLSNKNPEVYEDPLGRSDSLGNVRMIRHYPQKWSIAAPFVSNFGRHVAMKAQEWKAKLETQSLVMDAEADTDLLDNEDEKAASTRKSSRVYISKLKNHIFRDARIQSSLEEKLKVEKEKRLKKEKVIQSLVHQLRKTKSDKP